MFFLSPESKLYKAINFLGTLVILNFLWFIFSLPIVTVGASTVALYSVILKKINGTDDYLLKDFLKGFKINWKQGTVLYFITAVAIYGFYIDYQIIKNQQSIILIIASIFAFLIVCFSLLYAFPLCAQYENKIIVHIRNSFLLSIRYFVKTFFLVCILAFEVFILIWNTYTLIVALIIGPSLLIYTISGTVKKICVSNDN